MAIDPKRRQIELAKIALHEERGEWDRADFLREKLAELEEAGEADDCDDEFDYGADDDSPLRMSSLSAFPPRIRAALNRYGVACVEDLAQWSGPRLLLIPGFAARELSQIALTLAALGETDLLASAGDVPLSLPEPDPMAIDRLAGRTEDDCDRFLQMLAEGVPDRKVSKAMDSDGRWHQVSQSLRARLHKRYVPMLLAQFEREFKHDDWWTSASIDRSSVARYKLRLGIRVTIEEALGQLPRVVENPHRKGNTDWRWRWRGVEVVFDVADQQEDAV